MTSCPLTCSVIATTDDFVALDRADDAVLIAHAAERHGRDGGRRAIGSGGAAEMGARVEHHEEAADDGAHEPDYQRGSMRLLTIS